MSLYIKLLRDAGLIQCFVPKKREEAECDSSASVEMSPVSAMKGSATVASEERRGLEFARLVSEEIQFRYRSCEAEPQEAVMASPKGAEDQKEEYVVEGCEVMPDAMFYSTARPGEKVLSELRSNRFSYKSLATLRWLSDVAEVTLKHWDKLGFRHLGKEIKDAGDAHDDVAEEVDKVGREKVYGALGRFNRFMKSLVKAVEEEMEDRGQN
jgi:hypothetical protein